VLCEKDTSGEFCGVAARKFDIVGNCDQKSESACKADANCGWIVTQSQGQTGGYCDMEPTAQVLSSVCSPCLTKITNALGSESQEAREAASLQQYMCVKENGKFCFPLVVNDIRKVDALGFKNSTLQSVCSNRTKEKCMLKMMSGAASIQTRSITRSFTECLKSVSGSQAQNNFNMCVNHLESSRREVQQMMSQVNYMCRTNAAGIYCMSLLETDGPENNACLASAIQGKCTTDCQTALTANVNKWGCCLGNLHQLFHRAPLTRSDIPKIPTGVKLYINGKMVNTTGNTNGNVAPAPTPSTSATTEYYREIGQYSADNGLYLLGVCSEINKTLTEKLHIGCARPKGNTKVRKEKKLPVSFKKIKDDPVLEKRLVDGLTQDFATMLGLPTEDLVNPHLEEDTTTQVVTHRRRFSTLAESNGAKFVFEIQSTSDEATAEESAKFDQLVASGELSLPTATEVVADCGCKDETVKSLAVEAPPAPAPVPVATQPTNTTGSSAQGFSVLAVVAAFVALTLF
jgi:hypothetical protein